MRASLRITISASLLLPTLACAQTAPVAPAGGRPPAAAAEPAAARAGGELHAPFSRLLSTCVDRGVVDYAALERSKAVLDAYRDALAGTDPASLGRAETLAFWINAYNAFTLELILERYPGIGSIKDIPAAQRWKDERWEVAGRRYSLDAIEHAILRPLGDPRIHCALVCASRSCPDLASEAYVPERIDEQLDAAARRFLADRGKGLSFGEDRGAVFGPGFVLRLSAVFDWFSRDFAAAAGSVVDFVLRYAPADAAAFIREHREELDVESLDYDWSLNDR